MPRFIHFFLGTLFLYCTSCVSTSDEPAKPSKPFVMVSLPPYIEFVEKIAEDTVTVASAVKETFDPHVFEITPQFLTKASTAQLWIGVNEEFEEKIVSTIREHNPNFVYLNLTEKVPLLPAEDTTRIGHHHHSEGHDNHIWMSPTLAIPQARAITDALIALQPEHASRYEQNYARFAEELEAVTRELQRELAPLANSAMLINHASMGYFCHAFTIKQIALETAGKSLLPNELQLVEDAAQRYNLTCIYVLPQFEQRGAQQIAEQLNLSQVAINPLAPNYTQNLRAIAKKMVQCHNTPHVQSNNL